MILLVFGGRIPFEGKHSVEREVQTMTGPGDSDGGVSSGDICGSCGDVDSGDHGHDSDA